MAGCEEPPATPARELRPPSEVTIDVVISRPITHAAIARLCERVRMLLEGRGAQLIVCDVSAVIDPDAATIDALARVQLTARRLGGDVRLRNACDQLRDLVTFVGLADVVPVGAAIRLEPRRQAEEREQARGVEEEANPDDPAG